MRLKIAMRETEHPPRVRDSPNWDDFEADVDAAALGRNEGTVRFLFAPPRSTELETGNDYARAKTFGDTMEY